MIRLMNPSRIASAAGLLAGLLFAVAACGGGSGIANPSVSPGGIACDALLNESYQYSVQLDLDVGPVPTPPAPTGQGKSPFHFTSTVQGKVQDGARLDAVISNSDGANSANYEAIQIDNTGYLDFREGMGWQASDTSTGPGIPLPYRPTGLCLTLVPDINTTTLGSAADESVNGIDSTTYTLTDFPTEFFLNSPDFGGDAGNLIKNVNGSISIAKKGLYTSKFDITGVGYYPSGQALTVQLTFEASDMQGNIRVDAPAEATGIVN